MRHKVHCLLIVLSATGLLLAANPQAPPSKKDQTDAAAFEKSVPPVLAKTCAPCHNDRMASGGLNLGPFSAPGSIAEHREDWEKILQKIRTGEMPPKGIPRAARRPDRCPDGVRRRGVRARRPQRQARSRPRHRAPPEPQRVLEHHPRSARRRFPGGEGFPADDSGDGFDNIGDVLTISPVLMEKYIDAAERIAARAIGADPLPKKPLEAEYHAKEQDHPAARCQHHRSDSPRRMGRRVHRSHRPSRRARRGCEAGDDGLLDGRQAAAHDAGRNQAVKAGLLQSVLGRGDAAVPSRRRPVFRVGFIDDDFVKGLSEKEAYNDKKNKFLEHRSRSSGRFRQQVEKASRKKILICDPNSGPACVEKIVSTLARRAYRRPVTKSEVASLMKFVGDGSKAKGRASSRASSWRFRRCWFRRTSCSASSATRTRRPGQRYTGFPTSSWPRG